MSETRLQAIRTIKGQIVVKTGLRVGGSQETMEISGLDNPIIRNPANAEPFIPGSSLKGRMRSLAEWFFGEIPANGDVTKPDILAQTSRVFGIPARDPGRESDPEKQQAFRRGPTRLIVRDCPLSDASRQAFVDGLPITEVKSENSINRLTSMANPRPMERVLPGVRFDLEMVYRIFDVNGDGGSTDAALFDNVLLIALSLVEADALGGGSSRGNGKVAFENLSVDGKSIQLQPVTFPSSRSTAG